jgi:hypothetical protein
MSIQRLSCWFSLKERQAIQRHANEYGTTLNWVVRMAVREYLNVGKPLATQVTGNDEQPTDPS